MRPPLATALLVVLLATLIGCAKKRNADDGEAPGPQDNPGSTDGGRTGSPGTAGRAEQPPPWPPLPPVPARPKSFPETPGGRIAWGLDAAAESLVVNGRPPANVYDPWPNYSFRLAFKEAEPEIKGFPKARIEKEVYGPAGNATRERALIDDGFIRYHGAWTQYWERNRRWEVEKAEELLARLMEDEKPTPAELRKEAERGRKPGREVKVHNGNYRQEMVKLAEAYDWYSLDLDVKTDASGGAAWSSRVGGTGWVNGRILCDRTFTVSTGPMAAVLKGSVGEELWLQALGPAVIDLVEFTAPLVRVQTGEDILVRVGPGVKEIEVGPKRGVILARGNPKLRVRYAPEHHVVAVVGY